MHPKKRPWKSVPVLCGCLAFAAASLDAGAAAAALNDIMSVHTTLKIDDDLEQESTLLVRVDQKASVENENYFIEVVPHRAGDAIRLELKVGRIADGRHVLATPTILVRDGGTATVTQEDVKSGSTVSITTSPKML